MTDFPDGDNLERMVAQYLDELGRSLARLPTSQRDRLVGEIGEHIAELRRQRPPRDASDMEALLNRVGLPEDIAAVAFEGVEDVDEDDGIPSRVGVAGARAYFRRSRWSRGVVVAALVIALVAAVGVAATHHGHVPVSRGTATTTGPTLGPHGSPPSRLTVPNVIGESAAQGQVELQSAGFAVNVVSHPSGVVPGGEVFSQSPVAGAFMPAASMVTVYVSTGGHAS